MFWLPNYSKLGIFQIALIIFGEVIAKRVDKRLVMVSVCVMHEMWRRNATSAWDPPPNSIIYKAKLDFCKSIIPNDPP